MEDRSGAAGRMILVGRIVRPVGLRGEVVIEPTGDDPGRFAKGARLQGQTDPPRDLRILESRRYERRYAVRFEGIDSVDSAESLRGVRLFIPEEALPALPAGIYYHYQVLGLMVIDSEGMALGRIESILEAKGNDVYCVGEGDGELLIPAVRDYVERIDLAAGRLILRVPGSALGAGEPPI